MWLLQCALAFPDPETARAVKSHPNALRLFWGVQVPVTKECGVFNLDAFIDSFRSPAERRDAPFFFHLSKFSGILRSRAFVRIAFADAHGLGFCRGRLCPSISGSYSVSFLCS